MMYFCTTMTDTLPIDLTAMRERAGLTVREFARELGTYHTNVLNWEKAGRITKTEFIFPAASILGVTVEELLGLPKTRNNPIPGGKLGQAFEAAAKLPRGKQEKVIALLDAFVAQHTAEASSS